MAGKEHRSAAESRRAVEVIGVVHPLGTGGGRIGQEPLWTFRFSFVAWRPVGAAVVERELSIFQPGLSDAELRAEMAAVRPDSIVRVLVRFTEPVSGTDVSQAELVEVLGPEASDVELTAVAERLRRPVTVDHPFFGTLTLDRGLNEYEVEFPWNGQQVQLCFSRDGCEDETALFAAATQLWGDQSGWDERVRAYAATKLLRLKNGGWLREGEEELTSDQFKARMVLTAIGVYPDGMLDFTFNDGGLFWGHVIQVSGTLEDGPTDAGIAG